MIGSKSTSSLEVLHVQFSRSCCGHGDGRGATIISYVANEVFRQLMLHLPRLVDAPSSLIRPPLGRMQYPDGDTVPTSSVEERFLQTGLA